jgi:exopolyphosphatase/pppGpp-phosphohydrolase
MNSTSAERSKMKGLEPMRIEDCIGLSFYSNLSIEKLEISNIIQSNFALKEGAVYQLFNDNTWPYPGN